MNIYNPKTKRHAIVTDAVGARALKDGWVKADAELVAPELKIVKPKKEGNAKLPKETKAEEVKSPIADALPDADEIEVFKQSINNNQNAD